MKRTARFEIMKGMEEPEGAFRYDPDAGTPYYWLRLTGANGELMLSSQPYTRKYTAKKRAERINAIFCGTPLPILDKTNEMP